MYPNQSYMYMYKQYDLLMRVHTNHFLFAPGTISLTGDRVRGDDSKHYAIFSSSLQTCFLEIQYHFDVEVRPIAYAFI